MQYVAHFQQVVGTEIKIRVRISLNEEEKRLVVNTGETVLSAKRRLYAAGKAAGKDNVGENGDDEKSKVQDP